MIFLLLELHCSSLPDEVTKAYAQLNSVKIQAQLQISTAETTCEQTIKKLSENCQSAYDFLYLGKHVYKFDKNRAKELCSEIPNFIDPGEFYHLDDLYKPLREMGFDDIIKEISNINQEGSGRR